MCGIIGYIGNKTAQDILLNGLKRMEYRGYDSAGIATLNGGLHVSKCKGKVKDLKTILKNVQEGSIGIGHTRWATHGLPNNVNSHPHTSSSGKLAVVHNGIIENYSSLKKVLEAEGYNFYSETDTEVAAKLIESILDSKPELELEKAVQIALAQITGAYGFAMVHADYPDRIIVARKGSPLLIGIGDGEMLVASDASAVAEYTDKVIYLDEGEMAVIKQDSYQVLDSNDVAMDKEVHQLAMNLEEIEKGGFPYFMMKEIFEQPKTISDCLRGRINILDGEVKLGGLEGIIDKLIHSKRIVIAACGTSWHSGLVGEYLIESLVRRSVEVEYASEFRYKDPLIGKGDVLIVISQSGETADTLAAMRVAKKNGAMVLGIVNVVGSTIARETDAGVYLHTGPEIGVASTKAFTGQVTVLILIALLMARKLETLPEERISEILNELSFIPSKIQQILDKSEELEKIARLFTYAPNFLYLGRTVSFPVALEGALKLKEISYSHAEGYPAAEMKHGPIALIDEMMPVVVIAATEHTNDKMVSNIEEVKARRGRIISITSDKNNEVENLSEFNFSIPSTEDILSPLLSVIPLQLLSYYIAVNRGLNVDQPRNLAKSVTVE
jgi:glucosamine--fructose-6-phosphate aminotransferase (isomerizing)